VDVEYKVFGPLAVERGGRPLAVTGRVARRLLAHLLHRGGRPATVEALVDRVWGDAAPPTAVGSLRVHVNRLRRLLSDGGAAPIVTVPGGYVLSASDEQVDVARYASLVGTAGSLLEEDAAAALHHLVRARDLWRGPPWAELDGEAAVRPDVERLYELRRYAEELWADAHLALGHHGAIADRLRTAAEAEPLRERRWEQLVVALYRSGRQADALRAYERARERLAEEVGLEPGLALRGIYESVLHQALPTEPTSALRAVRRRPRAVVLHGRESMIRTIRALLDGARLVTLTGTGGTGKTAIALAIAETCATDFRDGTCFVDLEAATELGLVATLVGSALGIRDSAAHGAEPAGSALEVYLRDRAMLLVLDNCERAVTGVAHLVPALLQSAPGLRVLTTSRVLLGVAGEIHLEVPPLAVPAEGATTDDVRASPAVRLFAERSGLAASTADLDAAALRPIAELCRFAEGLPLAIEVAASAARSLSVHDVRDMLRSRLQPAPGTRTGRHGSVREAIAWSHDLLTDDDRVVFRRLAVFPGGFALDGAAAVAPLGRPGGDPVAGAVARLVGASLVHLDRDRPGRYSMLETVREFAFEQLVAAGEHRDTEQRLHGHLVAVARGLSVDGFSSPGRDALARVDAEHDTVRAVLEYCLGEGRAADALTLASAMGEYWFQRGHWGEGHRWLVRALDLAGPQRSLVRARALVMQARCASSFALIAEHADGLREAAEVYRSTPDAPRAEWFLAEMYLGLACGWLGRRDEAAGCLRTGRTLAVELGSEWAQAAVDAVVGLGRALTGDPAAARDTQRLAAERMLDLGDTAMAGRLLMYAGTLSRLLGDRDGARDDLQRSAALCEAAGIAGTAAHVRVTLAQLAVGLGAPDAAALLDACRSSLVEIGDRRCVAVVELELAGIAIREGRDRAALELLRTCVAALAATDRKALAVALCDVARLYAARGRARDAGLLIGAVDTLDTTAGVPLAAADEQRIEESVRAVERAVGHRRLASSRAEGHHLTLDEAVALASA
jgi:predicted ATPase/DNA-binding winged helix-turn-helix (wHTH) protein